MRRMMFWSFLFLAMATNVSADLQEKLRQKGIETEAVYTAEFWSNLDGGIKQDETYLMNLDILLAVDTGQFGFPQGGTLQAYFLANGGSEKLSGAIVGDLQTVSNIEAPRTGRLYELWYEQALDEISLLAGFHDYNADFAVTEYGGLLMNSSFGISPDISGQGRPSIFPLTALGARAKVDAGRWQYLIGIYDGNPGDPDREEHFPNVKFSAEDGAFIAFEAGYSYGEVETDLYPGFVKLGGWYNTGKFDDVIDVDGNGLPLKEYGNYGLYMIADKMIYQEDDQQGVGVFIQTGAAPKSLNEVPFYLGGGLHMTGLIPGRDEDQLGLAVAYAAISDDLSARDNHETVFELTYRMQINQRFSIQPDIQYIVNPGAVDGRQNAFVAGLRAEMNIW